MEKTTSGTRVDGFGCIPGESLQGLDRTEVLTTVMIFVVISLLLAGGVAAAAEWLRPDALFLGPIETPQCAGLAADSAR
ncbi:hypothetical protein [Mycolicibacterium llatzerense]|uniref:hypothetical protein n=1 Tax=Mycolicibacterium llatzerense TaxID=280871 RepID=UPI0013A6BF4D|nr:hypothetical protein [Mycolicibacterium llatzerense]